MKEYTSLVQSPPLGSALLWQPWNQTHCPGLSIPGWASRVDHDISLLTICPASRLIQAPSTRMAGMTHQKCRCAWDPPTALPVPAALCPLETQNSSWCLPTKRTRPACPPPGSVRPVPSIPGVIGVCPALGSPALGEHTPPQCCLS